MRPINGDVLSCMRRLHGVISTTMTFLAEGETMPVERSYDAIIIGAGQGAKPLSMVLARNGLKTALVEERYVGGSCINYG